jgi:hypothetical protein
MLELLLCAVAKAVAKFNGYCGIEKSARSKFPLEIAAAAY